MDTIKRLIADERGLETVEYAVITGLIVVATLTAISTLGKWVKDQFTTLNTDLATVTR